MIDRHPTIVTCPICKNKGRLNAFRPTHGNKTEYYIGHEQLDYQWGTRKDTKVQAIRRHYLKKPPHRDWANKIMGLVGKK